MSLSSNKLLIQAICEKTALEVLAHTVVLLKQYTGIGVNWSIAISNKAKANTQITTSYSKLRATKVTSYFSNEIHSKYTH